VLARSSIAMLAQNQRQTWRNKSIVIAVPFDQRVGGIRTPDTKKL
jgi:hypothetical protein